MTLYDTLGIPKGSAKEVIKRAWRRKAQRAHPDKAGGDATEFQKLQLAHDVLMDDSRRERYDATGDTGQAPDEMQELIGELAKLLLSMIDHVAVETTDLVAEMRKAVKGAMKAMKEGVKQTQAAIAKREKVLARMKAKGNGMLLDVLRNDIERLHQQAKNIERGVERSEKILVLLAEYEYQTDKAAPMMMYISKIDSPFNFNV